MSGVERLVVGERVMIFELASFAPDEHLTLLLRRHRLFGDLAVSYVVLPARPGGSRLVVKLVTVPPRGVVGALQRRLLPAGDPRDDAAPAPQPEGAGRGHRHRTRAGPIMTHRSAPPSRKDFEAMMAALSPHIVLHSPVTLSPFEGSMP